MAVGMRREVVLLALHKAFSERPKVMRQVFDWCGGEVEHLCDLTEQELSCVFGEGGTTVWSSLQSLDEAENVANELEDSDVEVVSLADPRYPRKLRALAELPPILYVSGDVSMTDDRLAVGVCGSRGATRDGLEFAREAGRIAGGLDVVVVSGGARGVDNEAHLGVLEGCGRTVLVLAEGIAKFRMASRLDSATQSNTLLVSQFYPRHIWQVSRAMARNATICGMSEAMIVVEAGDKGGTLAAGRECLKQGKRLLVVEHPDREKRAPGNKILLRKGGEPIRSPDELRSILPGLSAAHLEDRMVEGKQFSLMDPPTAEPVSIREESGDYLTQDSRDG